MTVTNTEDVPRRSSAKRSMGSTANAISPLTLTACPGLEVSRSGTQEQDERVLEPPAQEREALIGRLEWGLSYRELADAIGKPSSEAARKTAQRALVRLISEMGPSPSS